MTALLSTPRLDFELPPALEAHEPPAARDGVRLLVSRGSDEPIHARFNDLPRFLQPGDLLVINTSATIPAALVARRPNGEELQLHISTRLENGHWLVEPRDPAPPASLPYTGDLDREVLALPGGATATLLEHFTDSARLWIAHIDLTLRAPGTTHEAMTSYLARHGSPIRYSYVTEPWPIEEYQNVYASEPGSAEMPSAGRPITHELLTRLVAAGVGVAPLVLHTGVSSLEAHERPYPEYFRIPATTRRQVDDTHRAGGRVIAVGTTVVRALESEGEEGWTDVVIEPARGVSVVDGLITGWHEPLASHLLMLEAIAGHDALSAAYASAIAHNYRWHEFGDSHLIVRHVTA